MGGGMFGMPNMGFGNSMMMPGFGMPGLFSGQPALWQQPIYQQPQYAPVYSANLMYSELKCKLGGDPNPGAQQQVAEVTATKEEARQLQGGQNLNGDPGAGNPNVEDYIQQSVEESLGNNGGANSGGSGEPGDATLDPAVASKGKSAKVGTPGDGDGKSNPMDKGPQGTAGSQGGGNADDTSGRTRVTTGKTAEQIEAEQRQQQQALEAQRAKEADRLAAEKTKEKTNLPEVQVEQEDVKRIEKEIQDAGSLKALEALWLRLQKPNNLTQDEKDAIQNLINARKAELTPKAEGAEGAQGDGVNTQVNQRASQKDIDDATARIKSATLEQLATILEELEESGKFTEQQLDDFADQIADREAELMTKEQAAADLALAKAEAEAETAKMKEQAAIEAARIAEENARRNPTKENTIAVKKAANALDRAQKRTTEEIRKLNEARRIVKDLEDKVPLSQFIPEVHRARITSADIDDLWEYNIIRVPQGITFLQIADDFGIREKDLAKINGIKKDKGVYPTLVGQLLLLPEKAKFKAFEPTGPNKNFAERNIYYEKIKSEAFTERKIAKKEFNALTTAYNTAFRNFQEAIARKAPSEEVKALEKAAEKAAIKKNAAETKFNNAETKYKELLSPKNRTLLLANTPEYKLPEFKDSELRPYKRAEKRYDSNGNAEYKRWRIWTSICNRKSVRLSQYDDKNKRINPRYVMYLAEKYGQSATKVNMDYLKMSEADEDSVVAQIARGLLSEEVALGEASRRFGCDSEKILRLLPRNIDTSSVICVNITEPISELRRQRRYTIKFKISAQDSNYIKTDVVL
jgi:hypothetical protein